MYFPYLYGRRAERNALIDAAPSISVNQSVYPIVEPYSPASDLVALFEAYQVQGAKLFMIVNPSRGKLITPQQQTTWVSDASKYLAIPSLVTPAFHVFESTTVSDISNFLKQYSGRESALVILQRGLTPAAIAKVLGSRPVRIFTGPQIAEADYIAAMSAQYVVPLVPRFSVKVNADYPAQSSYSPDPKSFGPGGFGDFAIIDATPPRVGTGGGAAGAVAVHMTFQDPASKELKVQHFLSDDQEQYTPPVSLKLLQSIQHMVDQQAATPNRFFKSPGYTNLEMYLTLSKKTSLEKSKQQQINHHLYTIAQCL